MKQNNSVFSLLTSERAITSYCADVADDVHHTNDVFYLSRKFSKIIHIADKQFESNLLHVVKPGMLTLFSKKGGFWRIIIENIKEDLM